MSESTEPEIHIAPVSLYLKVFGALFVLTILTWAIALVDLGAMNTVVAIGIAVMKALLVIFFFMHLKYASRILWVVGLAGIIMTIVMFTITMSDYIGRSWIPYPETWL